MYNDTPYDVLYRSHVEKEVQGDPLVYFRFNNQMFSQRNESIQPAFFGSHPNVVLICVYMTRQKSSTLFEDLLSFIYGVQDQLKLHKKRLQNLNPAKFQEIREKNDND